MTTNDNKHETTLYVSAICYAGYHKVCSLPSSTQPASSCHCSCHAVYESRVTEHDFRWAMMHALYQIKIANIESRKSGRYVLTAEDIDTIVRKVAAGCTDNDIPEELIEAILFVYPDTDARQGWSWGDFTDDLKRALGTTDDPFAWKEKDSD